MAKTFTTPKRTTRVIEFELDGDPYQFSPPKLAAAVMPMLDPSAAANDGDDAKVTMTKAAWEWLRDGLPHQYIPVDDDDLAPVDDDAGHRPAPQEFRSRMAAVEALGEEQARDCISPQYDRIITRMKDPADDLDFTDVSEVVRWLIGQASGKPGGRRRA